MKYILNAVCGSWNIAIRASSTLKVINLITFFLLTLTHISILQTDFSPLQAIIIFQAMKATATAKLLKSSVTKFICLCAYFHCRMTKKNFFLSLTFPHCRHSPMNSAHSHSVWRTTTATSVNDALCIFEVELDRNLLQAMNYNKIKI
jgi:hypothetical protein